MPIIHKYKVLRLDRKSFYNYIGHRRMIANDQQLLLAREAIENLQRVLLAARKVYNPGEYRLMSSPVLLELQQREQEILTYLSYRDRRAGGR